MIICYGAYQISMGVLPAQNFMFVLYTAYIAGGFRGLVNNLGRVSRNHLIV
jgi:hypothetical protein